MHTIVCKHKHTHTCTPTHKPTHQLACTHIHRTKCIKWNSPNTSQPCPESWIDFSFSQLFKHINWNIRPNVHNLKFVYQLPNQFCWTPSTFSALDSDAHSKAHIFHNTTHNSIYLANSSWIPSIPPLGVHTEHTDNNISKLQRLLCNEQSAICYRRVTEESHDTR